MMPHSVATHQSRGPTSDADLRFDVCLRVQKYGVVFVEHDDPEWRALTQGRRLAMRRYIELMSQRDIGDQLHASHAQMMRQLKATCNVASSTVVLRLIEGLRLVCPKDVERLPPTCDADVRPHDRHVVLQFQHIEPLMRVWRHLADTKSTDDSVMRGYLQNNIIVTRSGTEFGDTKLDDAEFGDLNTIFVHVVLAQRASPVLPWYYTRSVAAWSLRPPSHRHSKLRLS